MGLALSETQVLSRRGPYYYICHCQFRCIIFSVALTAIDPRYVGAWWVGHLISIGLFVLVAVPFSCFGAEMPSKFKNISNVNIPRGCIFDVEANMCSECIDHRHCFTAYTYLQQL